MTIASVIIVIIVLSFMCPRRYLKTYYLLASLALSMLYLFAEPDKDADLYRHLIFLRYLKKVSWSDILTMRAGNYGYWITDLYVPRYMIFCIYSKIMSYFPRNLYIVPISFLIYIMPIKYVFKENQCTSKLPYIISYSFYLVTINFVSISAIRNIFAAMAFCFILYEELVEKKSKVVCWMCYILLCLVHAYAFFLLFVRIILIISNEVTKYIIGFLSLAIYTFVVARADMVTNMLQSIGGGGIASLLESAVNRGLEYSVYVSDDRWKLKILSLVIYMLGFVFVAMYYRYSEKMKEKENAGYNRFMEFYFYILFFSIGAYSQYDILVRGEMILMPIVGIFASRFLDELVEVDSEKIRFKKAGNIFSFILLMALMFFVFAARIYLQYSWADGWWR